VDKKKLLTIGEMSKFTGASIHSLRYYERIKVLTPAYIDPDTRYRYYNFDQINMVDFISFCIEMDIPLKDFPKFTQGDIMDVRAFLAEGKSIAIKKLSSIKRGLRIIKEIERQIDITEEYPPGQIYTRHIPQKLVYVRKVHNLSFSDLMHEFLSIPYSIGENEWADYGFFAYYSSGSGPHAAEYYAFCETNVPGENTKCIPAGEYLCTLSQDSQIENAHEIFREHLSKESSYIAIETEIFVAKYRIYQPMHEIRILII